MKKLGIYVLLAVVLIGVLTGCGKKEEAKNNKKYEIIT